MPDSKDIGNYPEWFWGILKVFTEDARKQNLEVLMEDKGSAYTARRQFYSWRILARTAGLQGVENVMGLSLAVAPREGGKWGVIFRRNAGISPESLAALLPAQVAGVRIEPSEEIPALPPPAAGAPQEDDAMEELLGRLLGATPAQDSEDGTK